MSIGSVEKKLMSDDEFRDYVTKLGILKNILHIYSFGGKELCCNTCNYYCKICWLCSQCESCCNWTEDNFEKEWSGNEQSG